MPGVSAQSRQIPTMHERLADYLTTNHSAVSRQEIRWLIAAWGAGPGVVILDPSLSWQRSGLAPLKSYLDRDGDGSLSRDEIAHADELLMRADVDTNDVVDVNEIRRAIDRPVSPAAASGYPLVVVLDANTDWQALESKMETIYGKRPAEGAGGVVGDARHLQSCAADITLKVSFTAADNAHLGVSVLATGPEFSSSASAVTAANGVVTLDLGGDYVEFSAAQGNAVRETDSADKSNCDRRRAGR